MLLVIEGPDGIGKTTLCMELVAALRLQRPKVEYMSFPGRIAGTLGEAVYRIHHTIAAGHSGISPLALQALHIAAHIDCIETIIRPALASGVDIVLDRYWWSTLVYGSAQGADVESLRALLKAEQIAWGGVAPSLIVLLTRSVSFRSELSVAEWETITTAYADLASVARRHGQPVTSLSVYVSPAELASQVIDLMSQCRAS